MYARMCVSDQFIWTKVNFVENAQNSNDQINRIASCDFINQTFVVRCRFPLISIIFVSSFFLFFILFSLNFTTFFRDFRSLCEFYRDCVDNAHVVTERCIQPWLIVAYTIELCKKLCINGACIRVIKITYYRFVHFFFTPGVFSNKL